MKKSLFFILFILFGCESKRKSIEDIPHSICDMKDGEQGCTIDWAFEIFLQSPHENIIYSQCKPPGTIQTMIRRKGEAIYFKNHVIPLQGIHCGWGNNNSNDLNITYSEGGYV